MPSARSMEDSFRGEDEILARLYAFCLERMSEGVTQQELIEAGFPTDSILPNVNLLMRQDRMKIGHLDGAEGQKLIFYAVAPQQAKRFNGLDRESRQVYQEIEKSSAEGCLSQKLKSVCNMQTPVVNKALKELLRRDLIKEVKSIQYRNRKVYMLKDIKPSEAVSGGSWYQDGEFDGEKVEELRDQCRQFLEEQPGCAVHLQELHQHVGRVVGARGQGAPSPEDVSQIMRTLELDEEVNSMPAPQGGKIYVLRKRGLTGSFYGFNVFAGRMTMFQRKNDSDPGQGLSIPCWSCPVREECHPQGEINPQSCEYVTRWLRPDLAPSGTSQMAGFPGLPLGNAPSRSSEGYAPYRDW